MPYAIFRYPPEDEFAVRKEVALLRTRLEQAGKRVTIVSLAECMTLRLEAKGLDAPKRSPRRRESVGLATTIETIHEVLSELRAARRSRRRSASPTTPIRFVTSSSSCGPARSFPSIAPRRCSSSSRARSHVPAVLFYPGELDGAAGLRFMGVLDAEHNYRPKIF